MAISALVLVLAVSTHGASAHGQDVPRIGAQRLAIGQLEGASNEVFGEIADLKVDERGNIYVLDGQLLKLSVFDSLGAFLDSTGRGGQGPGEFQGGVGAAVDRKGVIHVADQDNLRISTFQLSEGRIELTADARLTSYPFDICVIGDRKWVFQMALGEHLIHEVAPSGDSVRTFAPRERAEGEIGQVFGETYHLLYSGASLGCDPVTETVIMTHRDQPIVRAFSLDGREKWRRSELSGYRQMGYRRSNGSCCIAGLPDPESGSFHTANGIVPDGDGHVWVTLQEASRRPRRIAYEVRVLDAAAGAEVAQFPSIGFLAAMRNGLGYLYVNDPFPQVLVHEIR